MGLGQRQRQTGGPLKASLADSIDSWFSETLSPKAIWRATEEDTTPWVPDSIHVCTYACLPTYVHTPIHTYNTHNKNNSTRVEKYRNRLSCDYKLLQSFWGCCATIYLKHTVQLLQLQDKVDKVKTNITENWRNPDVHWYEKSKIKCLFTQVYFNKEA